MRNRTSQPGIRTTNAHTNATLEKQNKLPTVQLMLFCRLSDIVAHPVGTGSTSNNSRSWISCLVESLHVQLEQGSTSDNFRSWTQVLLISLVTTLCNSQIHSFSPILVTSWLVTICGIDMPASWNSIAWCPLSFGPTCCRSTCSKDSMSLETKLVFQVKSQQAKNIIQVQQSNKKKMSIELCLHNFIGYQVYSRTQSEQDRLRTTLGRGSRSSWGLCAFSRNKGRLRTTSGRGPRSF